MTYALKNLKSFAIKNPMIFILFIICQLSAAFVILMSYGAFQNFKLVKNENLSISDLTVSFGNIVEQQTDDDGNVYLYCDGQTDNAQIKKLLDKIDTSVLTDIEYIYYVAYLTSSDLLSNDEFFGEIAFRLQYSSENAAFVPYSVSYDNSPLAYGEIYSVDDFAKGKHVAILPCMFDESYVGKTVMIDGESYKVCGIDFMDDMVSIPYEDSPDTLDGITEVCFGVENLMSEDTYNSIKQTCEDVFGDYAVVPEIDTVSDNLPFYNSIMLLAIMLSVLSAITLMLLYRYILYTRNRMLAIFRLCGCTIKKARYIFISEVMLMSLCSFGISAFVYFSFAVDKLKSSFVYIDNVYSLKACGIILILFLGVTYVISNLMMTSKLNRSPLEQFKER